MRKEKQTKMNNRSLMLRAGKILLIMGISLMFTVRASADEIGDPDAPIDGGVSLLVAAGVAYGAKQWRNARKNKEEVNKASND